MLCSSCETDIAERNPHHRCRADQEACIEGVKCPDITEECDCIECWSFDEDHGRYWGPEVY